MLTKTFALILTLSTSQLLITWSNAQATSVPDCARGCVQTAASDVGCQLDDTICLCQASGFISNALSCASSTCQPEDQARSSRVLGEMCDSGQTTSGTPGTSTGTFTGTRSGSLPSGASSSTPSSSASRSSIATTATTLTVRPSLSFTTTATVPITTTASTTISTGSTQTTAPTTRPSTSSTTVPSSRSTVFSTSTQGPNGVSTAPPGATVSQTSRADTIRIGGLLWAAAVVVVALV